MNETKVYTESGLEPMESPAPILPTQLKELSSYLGSLDDHLSEIESAVERLGLKEELTPSKGDSKVDNEITLTGVLRNAIECVIDLNKKAQKINSNLKQLI